MKETGRWFQRMPGTIEGWKYMKARILTDGVDCYPWRPVFAWWPVKTIGGQYVRLRQIYKRRFWVVWGRGFHMEPTVEYGEMFDILKEDHSQA